MALGPSRAREERSEKRSVIPMSSADSVAEFKRQERSQLYVRPYVRSSTHKLRWTLELHQSFMRAVSILGGKDIATPKRILKIMDRDDVTIAHIKSHLQMYRIGKINADGMPMNADDPVLYKPISKALSKDSSSQHVELSPKEQREVYTALQLLKEGKVTGAAGAQKLLKGLADYKRFTTMAPDANMKLVDVKTQEFISAIDFPSGRKRKPQDDIELDLTIAPCLSSPKASPKFLFPSPSNSEEATLSLGLSVVR